MFTRLLRPGPRVEHGHPSERTAGDIRAARIESRIAFTGSVVGALVAGQTLLPPGVSEAINEATMLSFATDNPADLFATGILVSAVSYWSARRAQHNADPVRYVNHITLLQATRERYAGGDVHTITALRPSSWQPAEYATVHTPMPFIDGEVGTAAIQ
ncbi:MAG TPA: hypothetical protein VD735_02795 [Candidatus Saccharimonadales bacterium]|nr:hypothetical protein [Candidatus Saccharimonadales bacterium]